MRPEKFSYQKKLEYALLASQKAKEILLYYYPQMEPMLDEIFTLIKNCSENAILTKENENKLEGYRNGFWYKINSLTNYTPNHQSLILLIFYMINVARDTAWRTEDFKKFIQGKKTMNKNININHYNICPYCKQEYKNK